MNGVYRELNEFFLKFVEMYIEVDKVFGLEFFFNYFGMDKYYFRFVIGVDGVFFGKDDEVIVWLVLCLNVGSYIISESENFLFVGVNCSELYLCM